MLPGTLHAAVCAVAGFLGVNGSGKSTLMRILAQEDKSFDGELRLVDGIKIGYLEQEPKLEMGPTVDENLRPALAHMQSLLDEFEQVLPAALPRGPTCCCFRM